MSELQFPGLREARHSSLALRRNNGITDVVMQGISRDRSALYQVISLRANPHQPHDRRFVVRNTALTSKPGTTVTSISIVETQTDGQERERTAMYSRQMRYQTHTEGLTHFMLVGSRLTEIIKDVMAGRGVVESGNARPENGISQLYGSAVASVQERRLGHPIRGWRMEFLAQRDMLATITVLGAGYPDAAGILIRRAFSQDFRELGKPGVALAIYNTEGNEDADYATQPALVSLGRNPAGLHPEAIAEHVADTFHSDAVAVRRITRDPADSVNFIWSQAA